MPKPRRKVIQHPGKYRRLVNRLKEERQVRSLPQAKVADALGVSRSQYTALENGRSMLSFDHLCGLAQLYRISVAELLCGVA